MCLKTLLKKAVKTHYDDLYNKIEEEDNKQYDLESFNEVQKEKIEQDVLNKYNLEK